MTGEPTVPSTETRQDDAERIATMNGYMRVIRRVADDESYADSASVIESRLMSIRNLASIALREARS